MAVRGLVVVFTALIQFLCVAYTFPLSELFSNQPLFHIDSAFHWYQMQLAVDIAPGRVGYDPFFAAGYPGGVTMNLSAHVPALFAALLAPRVSDFIIYKGYVFVCAILGPMFLPLAAVILRLEFRHAALTALLAMILWWASMFHWYHTAGMVTFVMASFMALPFSALIYRYLEGDEKQSILILLGFMGALGFFAHPLFPIPVAFFMIAYAATAWHSVPVRRLVTLTLVVSLLSLIPNLFWLIPMAHHWGDPSVYLKTGQPYQRVVDINLLWEEFIGRFQGNSHGAKIYAPLFFGAVFSSVFTQNRSNLKIARCLTLSGVLILFFAAMGAGVHAIGNLQPNRFSPVGYLFLVIPAAIGFYEAIQLLRTWQGPFAKNMLKIGMAGFVTASSYASYEMTREMGYGPWGHYGFPPPEVRGVGEYSKWIVNFLENQTNTQGRVLFELSAGRVYDDAHMAGYYARITNREFIGGSYPYFHFANYQNGILFGHPIAQLDEAKFMEYMDLYNVGWILATSEASKHYLDHMASLIPLGEFKEVRAYRVNRTLGYFEEGKGVIKARSINMIALSNLEGPTVVLKYHFFHHLSSHPNATIYPITIMDDPTPFIALKNPPRDLVLTYQ